MLEKDESLNKLKVFQRRLVNRITEKNCGSWRLLTVEPIIMK